ncbi:hypothetical protein GCM10009838_13400 [Catenulispora subtropica]|uniref:Secreted protein n=2 Tax=Catenulispora subtropica TaxID=450798 RepID=A0ABP5C8Y4_9ACTN
MRRTAQGWLGTGLAAAVVVAGAAFGAHAASAQADPQGTAAQDEADRILTTFVPPPGSTKAASRPDPLPPDLNGPPERTAASTRATSTAWYSTSATPAEVLSWLDTHPPTGSTPAGSGAASTGPAFEIFQYSTPHSSLIVTPETGAHGRTVIRLDAEVIWTPSRNPDSFVPGGAASVTVSTGSRSATSTDPAKVQRVTQLLNALTPPIGGFHSCPMDDGTHVLITLPGHAQADVRATGCGTVVLTVPGSPPRLFDGGRELLAEVDPLVGLTGQR